MRSSSVHGASAPSPKVLQAARVQAAGVSPSLAVALADLFFPATRRDDLALLASVTVSRCSSYAEGAARG